MVAKVVFPTHGDDRGAPCQSAGADRNDHSGFGREAQEEFCYSARGRLFRRRFSGTIPPFATNQAFRHRQRCRHARAGPDVRPAGAVAPAVVEPPPAVAVESGKGARPMSNEFRPRTRFSPPDEALAARQWAEWRLSRRRLLQAGAFGGLAGERSCSAAGACDRSSRRRGAEAQPKSGGSISMSLADADASNFDPRSQSTTWRSGRCSSSTTNSSASRRMASRSNRGLPRRGRRSRTG